MADLDVSQKLQSMGVAPADADNIETTLQGGDFMNLIDALNDPKGPQAARQAVSQILGKYGVKLGGQSVNKDSYLGAKYESIRNSAPLDETFGGMLTKLGEGYAYSFELNEQNRDRVLDWLDENAVDYDALSATTFRINCEDRDAAYRTGRGLSGLLGKPTVRDSVEIEEKMGKKSDTRRVRDAKAKMAKITPEDPHKYAMMQHTGKGVHKGGKLRAEEPGSRKAKYKPRFDEEIEENLNEGVMGMKPVNPLFRLRELAGLPADDLDSIEIHDAPQTDPSGPLAAGPVGDDTVDADVDGMGADPVADPMPDMDGGMDDGAGMDMDPAGDVDMGDDLGMGDLDAGVPGDIGSDPIEAPMGMEAAPTQSEAMAQIEDALNNIQTGLADIRLSEYKSLIKKLQDLTNQAQMMGRDYLGEARRKK